MSDAPTTILDVLFERAATHPETLAFACEGDRATWGDLARDVARLAAVLHHQGLARGDRCAILAATSLDFVRLVYATIAAGAAPVAINPGLAPDRIQRRLALAGCRLCLTADEAQATTIATGQVPPQTRCVTMASIRDGASPGGLIDRASADPEAPVFLQFTSGTTGEPRAAVVRHRNLMAALAAAASRLQFGPDDVFVGWVPLYHDLGLVRFVFGPVAAGCSCHLVPGGLANLRRWLETMTRVRATVTASSDFGYRAAARLVEPASMDLRSLRVATNGGEAVRAGTIEVFERRFGVAGVVRPGYGLAEATLGVATLAPGEPLRVVRGGLVSCGRPMGDLEVRLVDEEGRAQPVGQQGIIEVRGATVFAGYFGDEIGTRGVLHDGGWLHTGDRGLMDADGHLYVLGRERALIKRGGATIAPREIEEVVDALPGVKASAAVGMPGQGDSGIEEIVVVVEVEGVGSGVDADAVLAGRISAAVAQAIGVAPARVLIEPRGSIPRTPNGKTQYGRLRDWVASGASAAFAST